MAAAVAATVTMTDKVEDEERVVEAGWDVVVGSIRDAIFTATDSATGAVEGACSRSDMEMTVEC